MIKKSSRVTTRQNQILEELEKCQDEMSGQQLHRKLQDGSTNMGLATVYRNLHELQQKGMVRSRHLPSGEVLYSPLDRDQHHLTCVDCGQTQVLSYCPVKDLQLPKNQTKKFQLLFHTLEFYGLCERCSKQHEINT
ncbi:transcriptional repressor [Prochlorococcus sp. MIT 1341]|uniref:Fur family transcriptional regulator n=1 Tax=Prochlorococcus sp. MIT 1341 TaxID=3096221 RepID=UPI002A74A5F6|nr:transcriptional repressor [Prochlorococcus sp. MIT 1341]